MGGGRSRARSRARSSASAPLANDDDERPAPARGHLPVARDRGTCGNERGAHEVTREGSETNCHVVSRSTNRHPCARACCAGPAANASRTARSAARREGARPPEKGWKGGALQLGFAHGMGAAYVNAARTEQRVHARDRDECRRGFPHALKFESDVLPWSATSLRFLNCRLKVRK